MFLYLLILISLLFNFFFLLFLYRILIVSSLSHWGWFRYWSVWERLEKSLHKAAQETHYCRGLCAWRESSQKSTEERAHSAEEERTATHICSSVHLLQWKCTAVCSPYEFLGCVSPHNLSPCPLSSHCCLIPVSLLLCYRCDSCGECLRLLYNITPFSTEFSSIILHSHLPPISIIISVSPLHLYSSFQSSGFRC